VIAGFDMKLAIKCRVEMRCEHDGGDAKAWIDTMQELVALSARIPSTRPELSVREQSCEA
jgi:hypothetical protein